MILAYTLLALAIATGGYADEDDRYYLQAADGWLASPPFVGTLHWHMRHPLVLAMAACIRLFGRTEAAVLLPAMASLLGTVALTYLLARRLGDRPAASLAAILVASTPVFTIFGKSGYPDIPEVFLVLLSFWLFLKGLHGNWAALAFAGVAIGVCWTMRASCAALVMLYAILTITRWRLPWRSWLPLWIGAAIPVAAELAYFAITTGNPFWRQKIDAAAIELPSAHLIGLVPHGMSPPFSWRLMAHWVPNSYVDVHWALNPFIDLLTNAQHGLLCLLGLVAIAPLLRLLPRHTEPGQILRLLCLWAALILFALLVVLNLRPQPRYFATLTCLCAIGSALWLRELARGRPKLVGAFVCGLVALDLAAAWLRPDQRVTERWLARYAAVSSATVWTTPEHAQAAELFLSDAGAASKVRASAAADAPPGVLFFLTAEEAAAEPAWPVVWRTGHAPSSSLSGRVLAKLYPGMMVVRVPLK